LGTYDSRTRTMTPASRGDRSGVPSDSRIRRRSQSSSSMSRPKYPNKDLRSRLQVLARFEVRRTRSFGVSRKVAAILIRPTTSIVTVKTIPDIRCQIDSLLSPFILQSRLAFFQFPLHTLCPATDIPYNACHVLGTGKFQVLWWFTADRSLSKLFLYHWTEWKWEIKLYGCT